MHSENNKENRNILVRTTYTITQSTALRIVLISFVTESFVWTGKQGPLIEMGKNLFKCRSEISCKRRGENKGKKWNKIKQKEKIKNYKNVAELTVVWDMQTMFCSRTKGSCNCYKRRGTTKKENGTWWSKRTRFLIKTRHCWVQSFLMLVLYMSLLDSV